MNQAYCEALVQAGAADSRVVTLDCDIVKSLGTGGFYQNFPDRSFNCGIQEENACSMAAGMSATGLIPFVHSFSVFTARRMYDQAFLSCAYAGLNVKLIGGDAGITTGINGGTHMPFEDMGIMRNIPTVRVLEPTDPLMLKKLLPQMVAHYGVEYMRMPRKDVMCIYEESSDFTIGKAAVLREGADVAIIANGILVYEALQAAQMLEQEQIHARVVDMFTLKPIDVDCIVESAETTGAILTAENHSILNGLGSAVAEVLVEHCPVPMDRIGIRDEFGQVGTQAQLAAHYKLTAQEVYLRAKALIKRK